jgi:hypothetical protein
MASSSPIFMDIGQGLSVMLGIPTLTEWNTDSRPKNARQGTLGFNKQTNSLEYFNGKYWLEAALSKS